MLVLDVGAEGCRFESHSDQDWKTHCSPSSEWVPNYNWGRLKAAKGGDLVPPLISPCQRHLGSNTQLPQRPLGYGTPLHLFHIVWFFYGAVHF